MINEKEINDSVVAQVFIMNLAVLLRWKRQKFLDKNSQLNIISNIISLEIVLITAELEIYINIK